MCITFDPYFPSFRFADMLLKKNDYIGLAKLLAVAPDKVENISKYHELAMALLDTNIDDPRITNIAVEKLKYCSQNGYLLSQQVIATIE